MPRQSRKLKPKTQKILISTKRLSRCWLQVPFRFQLRTTSLCITMTITKRLFRKQHNRGWNGPKNQIPERKREPQTHRNIRKGKEMGMECTPGYERRGMRARERRRHGYPIRLPPQCKLPCEKPRLLQKLARPYLLYPPHSFPWMKKRPTFRSSGWNWWIGLPIWLLSKWLSVRISLGATPHMICSFSCDNKTYQVVVVWCPLQ